MDTDISNMPAGASSDIEFTPPPSPGFRNLGKRSRAILRKNAEKLRISSQKHLDSLTFEMGDEQERTRQRLWVTRFNNFQKEVLKTSLNEPFKVSQLTPFIDSIMEPGVIELEKGEAAPSCGDLQAIADIIVEWGHFTWEEADTYVVDEHFETRLARCIADAKDTNSKKRSDKDLDVVQLDDQQEKAGTGAEKVEDGSSDASKAPPKKKMKKSPTEA